MDRNKKNTNIMLDDEEHIIDVAGSFKCRHQDDEYNSALKKWRSNKKNKYAYNYVSDTREHAYLDGFGFVEQHPDFSEKAALTNNINIIGLAMIISLMIETCGKYIIVSILRFFGLDITYDYISGYNCNSAAVIVALNYIVDITKLVVPIMMLCFSLKLPKIVVFPFKINNREINKIAIPVMLIAITTAIYMANIFDNILNFLNVSRTELSIYLPDSKFKLVLMGILFVFISPVLIEFCLRGAIMQPLRQFGDGFALLISSIISCLMVHDFTNFLTVFFFSLVIGYFVLATGSIITGIKMRICLNLNLFILVLINQYFNITTNLKILISTVILLVLICIGFVCVIAYAKKYKNIEFITFQNTYVSTKDKVLNSISTIPAIGWIILVFILSLIDLKIKV